MRSLCFSKVAKDKSKSWVWWDYVDKLGEDCPMRDKKYTTDCADKVASKVIDDAALGADTFNAYKKCSDLGDLESTSAVPLLDQELIDQTGNNTDSTIAILPTVRVNKKQYRGALDAPGVIRGICAAFPEGTEPSMCNENWVSDNECTEGSEGWLACNSGLNSTLGRTKCINTFSGWTCECGEGFMKVKEQATGQETCSEINECLMSSVPWTKKDCQCERCACINTIGGYNCTGSLPNHCTPGMDFGGCWRGKVNGRLFHACVDEIKSYRWLGEYGQLNSSSKLYRCECPPCFTGSADGKDCKPACDLDYCDMVQGKCVSEKVGFNYASGGGKKGVSGFGVFFIVLVTMGVTAGGMYGVYQMVVKQRMKDDMRNILEEYVPLNSAPMTDPYVRSAPSPAPNLNNV